MDIPNLIKLNLQDAINLKLAMISDDSIVRTTEEIAKAIINCFQKDGKVLFCGNGGSAADAQHLSSELSGRYYYDRPPLLAEALHVNTSYLTAVANDYSFDEVYARMTKAIGRPGDILVALSTSGNSTNVVNALAQAKKTGMITVGFTGENGGEINTHCDYLIKIPSTDTPRIQECHMHIGHTICHAVEQVLFPQ